MDLLSALEISLPELVAVVGSGGKTALMYALAGEYTRQGAQVVTTTTTKIYFPGPGQSPAVVLGPDIKTLLAEVRTALKRHPHVTAARARTREGKLTGPPPEEVDELHSSGPADLIIAEADGARGLPLKAPGPDEPVIPGRAGVVAAVVGLAGLGRRLDEQTVFRPERFAELAGLKPGLTIRAEDAARVMFHPDGPLRDVPPQSRIIVFLNQADCLSPSRAEAAARVFHAAGSKKVDRVVWGSLKRPMDGFGLWTGRGRRY